jgi:hypothetical protein
MASENNHRSPRRYQWPFPNCGPAARVLWAVCAGAWTLLLCTDPSGHIQLLYAVTAILSGVLAAGNVNAAKAVARVTGHVTDKVSAGFEAVTDAAADARQVTERLEDHFIGRSAPCGDSSDGVRPVMVVLDGGRRSGSPDLSHYFDVVTRSYRPVGELGAPGGTVPSRRSNAS